MRLCIITVVGVIVVIVIVIYAMLLLVLTLPLLLAFDHSTDLNWNAPHFAINKPGLTWTHLLNCMVTCLA